MARVLGLAAAAAVGFALVLVATIVTGVLAAVPTPAGFWSELKPIPGLALSLYGITITVLVGAVVALLSAAIVRLVKGITPAHFAACLLAVLAFGIPDLPASASLLWPPRGPANLFIALSVLVSLCAMPVALWLGYRIGKLRN